MPHRLALILCLSLSACAEFPDLDAATPPVTAAAPKILPLDQLLAAGAAVPGQANADAASLSTRAAALRARAAALRAGS